MAQNTNRAGGSPPHAGSKFSPLDEIERALAEHFAFGHAFEAAWRRARQSTEPRGNPTGRVIAKCSDADRAYLRREFDRRFARYRPRRRRVGAAP